MKWKKKTLTPEEKEQRKKAAENAALFTAFNQRDFSPTNTMAGGRGGGFDISNSQKIAAYNLLMNTKDEE